MKKGIFAAAMLALVFTACKKDKDVVKEVTPTKENLTGTYIITAATLSYGGTSQNVFNNADESQNYYEACQRDDQYSLNADLTYHVNDAGTQCSPPDTYDGTWELTNSTTIDLDGDVFTIKSFDGTNLQGSQDLGGPLLNVTFKKQ